MRDLSLQQLRELLTGNTVGVKGSPEPLHYTGPHVDRATDHPVGDSLNSLGYLAEDPKLLSTVGEFGTLKVRHFQSEFTDQVEVNEGGAGYRQLLTGQQRKWPPLHGKDKLPLVRVIVVAECDVL